MLPTAYGRNVDDGDASSRAVKAAARGKFASTRERRFDLLNSERVGENGDVNARNTCACPDTPSLFSRRSRRAGPETAEITIYSFFVNRNGLDAGRVSSENGGDRRT